MQQRSNNNRENINNGSNLNNETQDSSQDSASNPTMVTQPTQVFTSTSTLEHEGSIVLPNSKQKLTYTVTKNSNTTNLTIELDKDILSQDYIFLVMTLLTRSYALTGFLKIEKSPQPQIKISFNEKSVPLKEKQDFEAFIKIMLDSNITRPKIITYQNNFRSKGTLRLVSNSTNLNLSNSNSSTQTGLFFMSNHPNADSKLLYQGKEKQKEKQKEKRKVSEMTPSLELVKSVTLPNKNLTANISKNEDQTVLEIIIGSKKPISIAFKNANFPLMKTSDVEDLLNDIAELELTPKELSNFIYIFIRQRNLNSNSNNVVNDVDFNELTNWPSFPEANINLNAFEGPQTFEFPVAQGELFEGNDLDQASTSSLPTPFPEGNEGGYDLGTLTNSQIGLTNTPINLNSNGAYQPMTQQFLDNTNTNTTPTQYGTFQSPSENLTSQSFFNPPSLTPNQIYQGFVKLPDLPDKELPFKIIINQSKTELSIEINDTTQDNYSAIYQRLVGRLIGIKCVNILPKKPVITITFDNTMNFNDLSQFEEFLSIMTNRKTQRTPLREYQQKLMRAATSTNATDSNSQEQSGSKKSRMDK